MAKDLFSGHAGQYAQFRPTYPDALFQWLVSHAPGRGQVWDAGTGNGQAAVGLAPFFDRILATDISQNQLSNATPAANVTYVVAPAEECPLPAQSADLIVVGQALHWFDFEVFAKEVRRVAKPGAFFAAWTYNVCRIDPASDELLAHFYHKTVGPHWDVRRKHVDEAYASIALPVREIAGPAVSMDFSWDLARLCAYIRTWSSVQGYIRVHGYDPVDALQQQLAVQWPEGALRTVVFPFAFGAGWVE